MYAVFLLQCNVHLLYELEYVILYVGKLTEEKSHLRMNTGSMLENRI
jgi:hypothetical protein